MLSILKPSNAQNSGFRNLLGMQNPAAPLVKRNSSNWPQNANCIVSGQMPASVKHQCFISEWQDRHSTPVGHGTQWLRWLQGNVNGPIPNSPLIPPMFFFFFFRRRLSFDHSWDGGHLKPQGTWIKSHWPWATCRFWFFRLNDVFLFLQTWSYTWLWWGFIPSFPSKDQPTRNYP